MQYKSAREVVEEKEMAENKQFIPDEAVSNYFICN